MNESGTWTTQRMRLVVGCHLFWISNRGSWFVRDDRCTSKVRDSRIAGRLQSHVSGGGAMNCNSCGAPLEGTDTVCRSCGAAATKVPQPRPSASGIPSDLPEYYRSEFQKIGESNEQYKGKWNWAACFLGPIWAFSKGLREVVAIYVMAIPFTFGISVLGYAVIFGLRGNYFYYSKLIKRRVVIV